jgi:hypothetical protein
MNTGVLHNARISLLSLPKEDFGVCSPLLVKRRPINDPRITRVYWVFEACLREQTPPECGRIKEVSDSAIDERAGMTVPIKETPTDIEVQEALRQVLALRALTASTGTVTTYTQNKVLRALSPEALTRVAVILTELEKSYAATLTTDRGAR